MMISVWFARRPVDGKNISFFISHKSSDFTKKNMAVPSKVFYYNLLYLLKEFAYIQIHRAIGSLIKKFHNTFFYYSQIFFHFY